MKKVILIITFIFVFNQGHGSTSLHEASYKGDFRKVYLALKKGAKIEETDSKGRTAIFYAIYQSSSFKRKNKYRIVYYLIRKGADVNKSDYAGRTPLHEAIRYRNRAISKMLINNGAGINSRDDKGITPLHEAAKNGMKIITKLLVSKGGDVNATDKSGWTPLHESAAKGQHKIIKLLINEKAYPDIVNEDGNSPLHLASGEENIISIIYLLRASRKFLNVKNIFGKTPLYYAVRSGSIPLSKLLIDSGARIDENDHSGFTPFFYTARMKNVQMAKFLIKNGADINHKNKTGVTPLHYSALMGNDKMISLLLKKGADKYSKTARGLTYIDILKNSSYLFQYEKCDKKLPRLYLSHMEGKRAATSYYSIKPYLYSVEKCFDNNIKTCWIEGDKGNGIGEKIAFYSEKEIRYISVFPGHGNRRLFKMHNRLHRAKITIYENKYQLYCNFKFGNELNSFEVSFDDLPVKKKIPVRIKKNSPNGYIIVIEIKSVYRGTKWKNDTCIAEVETI